MNEKKLIARVMKEIGSAIQETPIEGNYQGNQWEPDLRQTLSSLGAQIIIRGKRIEEKLCEEKVNDEK